MIVQKLRELWGPEAVPEMAPPLPPLILTPREQEVLVRIRIGKSDQKIAADLHLSVRTVNNLVNHLLKKLEVPNRTALAFLSFREDLFRLTREAEGDLGNQGELRGRGGKY